ncbi:nitroreductase [Kutzneria albida DSM 43870]|uniref:Nitroreductase n=3 Tax=Kutzneria TaxID=43356 RepID=W5W7M0_9PSEU|nr:nitroreductase [Kutzneria albida DSM 43870]
MAVDEMIPGSIGLSPDEVLDVLEAASRAPSVHNTQPWRFRVLPDRIELHADLARRLHATDPTDRELRLACGAALLNLRVAVETYGIKPLVSLLPGASADHALAVVRHGGHVPPSASAQAARRSIDRRRTNRKPFHDVAVPATHTTELVKAAQQERSWLHVVTGRDEWAELRRLVAAAHRVQMADAAFVGELITWTGRGADQFDGVPATAAGPSPEPQDEWVLRDYNARTLRPRREGKDFEHDPLLVVLCSYYEGPLAELQTGQALQRVLLTATELGMCASFLSQPIEVPAQHARLRRLLGSGAVPQVVLRVGFGSPVPATPRRPVTDLLTGICPAIPGGV